jgi:hypothetical protein
MVPEYGRRCRRELPKAAHTHRNQHGGSGAERTERTA